MLPCRRAGPRDLGIDNFDVAKTIGRAAGQDCLVKPLPLVKDGDLVARVQYMIRTRGRETVRVTKVEGHAQDSDVQHGRVRLEDQLGNVEADTAADLGRRQQSEVLIDARRRLLQLHKFKIAVARGIVNHDGRGGTAPDPLVWDQRGPKKARKFDTRVNGDLASLPGPPGFLSGPWIQVHGGCISGADVAAWPCSVAILCKFTSFLGTLHWTSGSDELLILLKQWVGQRLLSEKVIRPHVGANGWKQCDNGHDGQREDWRGPSREEEVASSFPSRAQRPHQGKSGRKT